MSHPSLRCRRAFVLAACLAGIALTGAASAATTVGNGPLVTESRSAADFQSISISGSIDLHVRQSGQEGVQVQAQANLLPLIETTVEGRTLAIRWKDNSNVRTSRDVMVTVDVKELKAITASGSGDIRLDALKGGQFKLSISGSGDARLDGLAVEDLGVSIAGSGDVRAQGRTARFAVRISGSGDVDAAALESDDVTVAIAGSGDASVVARKALEVSIAGSGDVSYSGQPDKLRQSVAGSGTVSRR